MQVKNNDGSYGALVPFDQDEMETLLSKPDTESVEVFKASDKQIIKHNKYSIGKRFKKAPRIKK